MHRVASDNFFALGTSIGALKVLLTILIIANFFISSSLKKFFNLNHLHRCPEFFSILRFKVKPTKLAKEGLPETDHAAVAANISKQMVWDYCFVQIRT